MKKILKIILIFITYISCKTSLNRIDIKQDKTDKSIVLYYSKKMKTISVVSFPIAIRVINNSSSDKYFLMFGYKYGRKGNPINMYINKSEKLIRQSVSSKKSLSSNSTQKYLIYTKHFVDTTKFNRNYFSEVIEELKVKNKDTIHIKNISKFKTKFNNLYDYLIKNDSLYIQLLDNNNQDKRITTPIK